MLRMIPPGVSSTDSECEDEKSVYAQSDSSLAWQNLRRRQIGAFKPAATIDLPRTIVHAIIFILYIAPRNEGNRRRISNSLLRVGSYCPTRSTCKCVARAAE
jgi:hypothetical protein